MVRIHHPLLEEFRKFEAEAARRFPADFMAYTVKRPCNVSRILILAATVVFLVGCGSRTSQSKSEKLEDSAMESIDLADETFERILKKYGDNVDPSKMTNPEKTVIFVYHSYGIIGNGGFQYLFEGDFPGDPEYLLTRQAYKTIGAADALAAFEKAFAVFPDSTPLVDVDRRLEMWQSNYNVLDSMEDHQSPDMLFFQAMDGVVAKLNAYIEAHRSEFASLPELTD